MTQPPFSPIDEILDELRAGRMVVVTDDESRENEGDLVLAAEKITPDAVNFMVRQAAGYMFVSLTNDDCDRLGLHGQTPVNTSARGTPLTVSIDGAPKHGFTTGVSATERANTIKLALDPSSGPDDFVRPGHVNPLRSRDGGVLVRTGHTEAIVDLARLAGLYPAAVGIEICRPDGEMARVPELETFCKEHTLKMCSIEQIIQYRLARETLIHRHEPKQGATLRTSEGEFNLIAFDSVVDPLPHLALTVGDVGALDPSGAPIVQDEPTLVRMHRRRLLGDVFGDLDSSPDGPTDRLLRASMRAIQREGRGAVVYLRPEGAGESREDRLVSIKRPQLDSGADTPDLTRPDGLGGAAPMEQRTFGIGGQILRNLGLRRLRLMTNSRRQMPGLEAFGLEIVEHVPLGQD
ncbi:MAG: 3,4-dihydroxy-2-butanone-4-phosphate synthase [Planctomycetota bacterium]